MEFTSNYERQCEEWRQKIAQMDIGDICRRVPEVEVTQEALLLWHFGRQFAVDQKTGAIRVVSDDGPLYAISKLNIYTLFGMPKKGPDAADSGSHIGSSKARRRLGRHFREGRWSQSR